MDDSAITNPPIKDELVRSLVVEMKNLKADMVLLKGLSDDKSIKFGGLGLKSIQECHLWIKVNFEGYRYGLMMDPLLILDSIFGSDNVMVDSQFKAL